MVGVEDVKMLNFREVRINAAFGIKFDLSVVMHAKELNCRDIVISIVWQSTFFLPTS